MQRARLASLPGGDELRTRLALATMGLPLSAQRLDAFVADVEAARNARPVIRADLNGTSLATAVDGMLFRSGSRWQALMSLRAPAEGAHPTIIDAERVRSELGTDGSALLVDIKQETDALYASYFAEASWLSFAGLLLIVVLLLAVLKSPLRVTRVVLPLLLSVLAVAAGLAMAGVALTIMHLVGMLLIVAVGSNYALFFDRQSSDDGRDTVPLTLASLLIANAATVVGFGVLATSSVPVLQALGMTVSPGALLALLFAALLSPVRNR
jgi:predicted exporter